MFFRQKGYFLFEVMNLKKQTKFIFVTGGVVSSLGKGIAASSIGRLLKMRGLKVFMQKFDPYINVDSAWRSFCYRRWCRNRFRFGPLRAFY